MLFRSKKSVCLLMLLQCSFQTLANNALSLNDAIKIAQQNDPWLHGSKLKQQATLDNSIAAGSLPDPTISLSLLNLPVDSWSFNQEAMTQFKVGVSQMLPRGDSLAIKQQQLQIEASRFNYLQADRSAKIEAQVTQLWLDVYLAQKILLLINNDKALFAQMVDIANANYSTAVGKTRQQDVIRAQLELVQLDDRLTEQYLKLETAQALLNEWLYKYDAKYSINFSADYARFGVTDDLPVIEFNGSDVPKNVNQTAGSEVLNQLAERIQHHPALQAIESQYQAATKTVVLAKQQYTPQWGVNANYSYRDNAQNGMTRADFFSVGVTFDVPLFTENKQDKVVSASLAQSQAIKTEKLLTLRTMIGQIDKELRLLNRLSERQTIYKTQLLSQTHEQAEASLTAYTNDDGDFAEVVRARIAELNTRIAALNIDIDALKTIARLNYYFVSAPPLLSISQEPDNG